MNNDSLLQNETIRKILSNSMHNVNRGVINDAIISEEIQCLSENQHNNCTNTVGASSEVGCEGERLYESVYPRVETCKEIAPQNSNSYDMCNGDVDNPFSTMDESPQVNDHCGTLKHESIPLSSYKIQYDPNPNIIRRHIGQPVACYRQNISVRYLQPPPPPPPGPIVIKEVRTAQAPPAPPVVIRQRPNEPKTPPPLVLREKPPVPPCVPAAQVIVKRIPPPPPPLRQVIVERYPPFPPKPRDIIIEKWLPYRAITKRAVILQKAPPLKLAKPPKNIIVQYVGSRPQIDRVFKQLGIVPMNPVLYLKQYGSSLVEPLALQATAMREGILDAIKAPFIQYTPLENNRCHYFQNCQVCEPNVCTPTNQDCMTLACSNPCLESCCCCQNSVFNHDINMENGQSTLEQNLKLCDNSYCAEQQTPQNVCCGFQNICHTSPEYNTSLYNLKHSNSICRSDRFKIREH